MSESCGSPPTLDNVVGNVCPSSEFLRQGAPGRVSLRVDADHPPPTHDAVNARHRTVQVARSVVEAMAGAAGDHVAQVYIPATPTTRRTLKPRSADARHRLVPRHRNAGSINQNIGGLSADQVAPGPAENFSRRRFEPPGRLRRSTQLEASKQAHHGRRLPVATARRRDVALG